MVLCSKCGVDKSPSEFNKDKSHKNGLKSACRVCTKGMYQEWFSSEEGRQYKQQYDKERHWSNREVSLSKSKRWREANRLRHRELVRNWDKSNPALRREYDNRRRARLLNQLGQVSADIESNLFEQQRGLCYYCQEMLNNYHLEHKIPLSRGGLHDDENLCLSCAGCNLRKHTKTSEEFMEELSGEK